MKKGVVFTVVVFVLIATLISGCGTTTTNKTDVSTAETKVANDNSSSSTAAEKTGLELKDVTLKYYTDATATKLELDAVLPEFNKKYPGIKVEYIVIPDDYATKVKTALVAGEQIDVFSQDMAGLNRATPDTMYLAVDDIAAQDNFDLSKNFGDYLKQFQVNGKAYGLPKMCTGGTGFVYNKRDFDEVGLAYPTPEWTWNDFIAAAKKLMKKDANGKTQRYGAFDWSIYDETTVGQLIGDMAFHAGWEMVKDDGSPNLDDPRLKKAIEFYYQMMMVDKSMPTVAETKAKQYHFMYDMYKDKWSMCIGFRGSSWLDVHREAGNLPAADDDANIYAGAWMPRFDENIPAKTSLDQSIGDCISANTKYKNEAYTFTKWHATEATVLASKIAHRLPCWIEADRNVLKDNFKYYKNKDSQIVEGKYRPLMQDLLFDPGVPIYPVNTLKYSYTNSFRDILGKHVNLLLAGAGTIDDAIANAKKEIEVEYNKVKSK